MAKVSAGEMLGRLRYAEGCSEEEKRRWLSQAEGFVRREALGDAGETALLGDDDVLTAEMPYDEMYRHYVEAQCAYALGEMARYNNAAAAWNSGLLAYRDYCCRRGGRAERLKVC